MSPRRASRIGPGLIGLASYVATTLALLAHAASVGAGPFA